MRGTEAWRKEWRSVGTRRPVALVSLVATDGSALLVGTTEHVVDGIYFETGVLEGVINSGGGFLRRDVDLPSAKFEMANVAYSGTGGVRLGKFLAAHSFVHATVNIYFGSLNIDSFADTLLRFTGYVQSHQVVRNKVTFSCAVARDFNRVVRPRVVTRAEFPNADESAFGAGLPIVIGDNSGPPFRLGSVAGSYPLAHFVRDKIAGGHRAGAAMLVDVGRGYGATNPPARVMVAGHKCVQVGGAGPAYGTSFFLVGEDGAMHVVDPSAANTFNTDTGAGFVMPDDTGTAWQPVFPSDVEQTVPPADNPRALLERRNETAYARIDFAQGKARLAALLSSGASKGTLKNAWAYCVYRTATGTVGAKFVVEKGASTGQADLNASAGTVAVASVFLGSAWGAGLLPSQPWNWSELKLVAKWFVGVAGNAGAVDVLYMGIAAEYAPAQDVLTNVKTVELQEVRQTVDRGQHRSFYVPVEVRRDLTELRSSFAANVKGYPDDASGTYTDTPASLVERVPDVAHLVLRQFGGLQNVNQTPGTVGCFDDSRALFKTWRDSDMRLAMTIMEAVDVKEVLRWVMEAGLCDIFLSEFTGQWHLVPWVMAPASTYADALQASEVLEPEVALRVSTTLDADVVSGVRMVYGWDHVSRGFVHETSLAGSRSSAGHGYLNLRDGSMLVVAATNDAIDYSVAQIFGGAAAGTKAATLAAAAYQLDDLPLAVITALETGDPARKYQCGVVGRIVAGVNDAIEWVDSSGVNRTAFVLEGVYTMPGLCAAVQTAMASPWTVSYSRATRRVTVTSDGGASAIRTTGPLRGRSVWPMLGFANGYNPLAPQTNLPVAGTRLGDYEREEERIYIGCADTTMDINWRSGPSGYYGTRRCCAEVVGFDWSQDSVGGRASHMSASFKNNRELAVAATDAEFGVKRELTIDGRAVVDTDTAVEARNRLLALLGKVRGFVEVSTEIHADAERGDVLPCDASLDDIGDYAVPGTDGSFAGKAFRVVNTQTSFGRSFHTELVLADMS